MSLVARVVRQFYEGAEAVSLEAGRHAPTVGGLNRLAKALDVDPAELLK